MNTPPKSKRQRKVEKEARRLMAVRGYDKKTARKAATWTLKQD